MKRARAIVYVLLTLAFVCGNVSAQDAGNLDTVRVAKVTTNAGLDVGVPVTSYNSHPIGGYSLGFHWDSGDVAYDSISYSGSRIPSGAFKILTPDLANQRVLVGFADLTAFNPLPAGDGLLFTLWFSVAPAAPDQFIKVDSMFVPPAGNFEMVPQGGLGFTPQFKAGEIKVGNPQPPAIISLGQSSFTFNGLVGQGNPPTQLQQITNVGGQTLVWTATKSTTWLVLSPMNGTAPSTIVVGVNTVALGAGTYQDSVFVSAPNASNSPQKFYVTLNMTVPPPTIKLTPDSLYFQALQNGSNPAGQNFTITNIGQGTLNWTATEAISWLSLSATNGTAPSNVTVSVDNTALGAGVYKDSVAISDGTATNSPQYLVVVFEIFSAFPVIDPVPDSIYAIGSESQNPYNRILTIENDGGGTLQWSLTKTKPWLSLSVDTGSTVQGSPSTVTLSFNRLVVDFGKQYDTIVIHSTNAINAPKRVPVTFWKMEVPQNMSVSTSALNFSSVECGTYPPTASKTFLITPLLGTPLLYWHLSYDAPWLSATPGSGSGQQTVTVKVNVTGLGPGVYMDTIYVSSDLALDPPKQVVVTFTVAATPATKVLQLSRDSLLYIFKYTQLGSANQKVYISNQLGGCVDWAATSTVPFLTPEPAAGTTVDSVMVRSDPIGLSLGRHTGSIVFTSNTASNSPLTLPVVVWIYTFGDANGDGIVNVSDCVYIVNYIFSGGPAPVPIFITGDVDCNRQITISDVVYLLNWIFIGGPEPCLY